ncbi:MAG TPA: hypothetical protein VFA89_08275 [Terriglobales bacterium]|nr:hypothetical protein [Terriglobales bacterium]
MSAIPVRAIQIPAEHSYVSVVSLSLFQHGESPKAVAHVPFDFRIGDVMFKAGRYALGPSQLAGMFFVRADGREGPAALVQAVQVPRQRDGIWRKLLFYRQNARYFLAQVLVASDELPTQLPPPLR